VGRGDALTDASDACYVLPPLMGLQRPQTPTHKFLNDIMTEIDVVPLVDTIFKIRDVHQVLYEGTVEEPTFLADAGFGNEPAHDE